MCAVCSIDLSRTKRLPARKWNWKLITLAPGDVFLYYKKAGTAALTTTSNDGLTVAVSAGNPTCKVLAGYGS